jgi:hypothetical protein
MSARTAPRSGPRPAPALRVAALPLSRGPQLRAGHLDGPGPGRRLCRSHSTIRPPPVGRSSTPANTSSNTFPRAPAARHSSPRRQALQALRHRPDRPARPAHLAELFGGDGAARDLTPAWDGGIYWAGQRSQRQNSGRAQASTKSLALFYLSAWKNAASAQAFARLYAEQPGPQILRPQARPRSRVPMLQPPPRRQPNRSTPPAKARSSSPPAASWSSSPKASTSKWPASSPPSSSTPREPAN